MPELVNVFQEEEQDGKEVLVALGNLETEIQGILDMVGEIWVEFDGDCSLSSVRAALMCARNAVQEEIDSI